MCRYFTLLEYHTSKKRVRRLIRLMGPMAVYQKPKTSDSNPEHKRYPHLLHYVAITGAIRYGMYGHQQGFL